MGPVNKFVASKHGWQLYRTRCSHVRGMPQTVAQAITQ